MNDYLKLFYQIFHWNVQRFHFLTGGETGIRLSRVSSRAVPSLAEGNPILILLKFFFLINSFIVSMSRTIDFTRHKYLDYARYKRRDWDSNPGGLLDPTRSPGVLLHPLGHLSCIFILTTTEREGV